ncbi:MAG: hypothetical protein EPN49_07700 [Rhodanobacter sp.]|nr:MAG: hypothetical protein EPN49_07700 [Rhodanobacter sp.]
MGRPVLMIAYHFPPAAMGSGHLRTLGFARYLPASGWDPIVLSARALAYPRTAPVDAGVIPRGCLVRRALAFDARRHFGVGGKYPGFLAQPDRWVSWWPAAVWQGLRLIRRHRVRAIWSTYPIMTAHCIARTLSRLSGLPWIADFRDPVASSVSAENAFSMASQHRWEPKILHSATRATFTTPGALRAYAERYPETYRDGRMSVIPNGYDETAFIDPPQAPPPTTGRPLVLLHSGLLYPEGRNPVPFFTAVARLKASGSVTADNLRVVLRASGSEAVYAPEIQRLGLDGMVVLAPPISNREALMEQATADALLLFQGRQYDQQIPAKLYEYLRVGRPIFALVGEHGDTAAVLRNAGGAELVQLDDIAAIQTKLLAFIKALHLGQAPQAQPDAIARYSRREGAAVLARLLDQVATENEE